MKKLLFALALVVLLGGLSLGLSASTAQASPGIHYCTLDDEGATETLDLGEGLVVNLGSGYTWKVTVVDPYGHPVLRQLWSKVGAKNGDPTYVYFHSIGFGRSIIRADGTPTCSGNCLPYVRHFELNVVVQ